MVVVTRKDVTEEVIQELIRILNEEYNLKVQVNDGENQNNNTFQQACACGLL